MEVTPSTDALPVPREALIELGLTDVDIEGALERRPKVVGGYPGEAPGAWFDVAAVERAVRALCNLRHTKTRRWQGTPLVPDPWQVVWIIAPVFGWKNPDGTRVVREAFIEVPRKNGKTTVSTGLMVVLLTADGEPGAEVYSAAVNKDGATRILEDAKSMMRSSPALRRRVANGQLHLLKDVVKYRGGIFRALSKVADAAHGLNVSGAVIDELHVHKTRDLLDVIITGTGARDQPLVVIITTADEGDEHSIYAEYHDRTTQIADRVVVDPSHYGVIWAADDADDPFARETLAKANPGAGTTVTWEYLEAQAEKARNTPAYLPTYKRLHLNLRAKSTAGLISMGDWMSADCSQLVDHEQLVELRAWGGLDLSATTDFTAATLWFPDDPRSAESAGTLLAKVWVPEERLEQLERACRVPLAQWVADGWLETTEGNVVDYRVVRRQLTEWRATFDIAQLGYDPWSARETINELADDGWPLVEVRQGSYSLSNPTKLLERLVLQRKVRHGGDPVMRWMADSLHVRRDDNDNVRPVKPDRDRSAKRIDGMSALITALFCWQRAELPARSAYEEHGLEVI